MSKFFLYNGVELPGLPEWDKIRYPYAFIYIVTLDGTTGVYTLVVTSSNVMSYDGNGIICTAANVGQRYTVSGEEWAAAAGSDDFYIKRDNLIFTVWANFDVLNSDGSVYVAASEPVPVAGKFPLREWVGWLIAGLCSRPLPVSVREPVAYLYNGVRLPAPPKYDASLYPYSLIYKRENSYLMYCFTVEPGASSNMLMPYSGEQGNYIYAFLREGRVNEFGDPTNFTSLLIGADKIIWTNFDLRYRSGGMCLEKSEPVPVYE